MTRSGSELATAVRIFVLLLVGGFLVFAVWIAGQQRRYAVDAEIIEIRGAPVHAFGTGTDAIVIYHAKTGSPDTVLPFARLLSQHFPARYVLPRGPYQTEPAGYTWYRWLGVPGHEREHAQSVLRTRSEQLAMIDGLRHAGVRRLVIIGHSSGCRTGTDLALALDTPPDAVACLGGAPLTTWRTEHAAGLRVFVSHGRRNPYIPFAEGEAARDVLQEHGARVTWVPHDGGFGFESPEDALIPFLRDVFPVDESEE